MRKEEEKKPKKIEFKKPNRCRVIRKRHSSLKIKSNFKFSSVDRHLMKNLERPVESLFYCNNVSHLKEEVTKSNLTNIVYFVGLSPMNKEILKEIDMKENFIFLKGKDNQVAIDFLNQLKDNIIGLSLILKPQFFQKINFYKNKILILQLKLNQLFLKNKEIKNIFRSSFKKIELLIESAASIPFRKNPFRGLCDEDVFSDCNVEIKVKDFEVVQLLSEAKKSFLNKVNVIAFFSKNNIRNYFTSTLLKKLIRVKNLETQKLYGLSRRKEIFNNWKFSPNNFLLF